MSHRIIPLSNNRFSYIRISNEGINYPLNFLGLPNHHISVIMSECRENNDKYYLNIHLTQNNPRKEIIIFKTTFLKEKFASFKNYMQNYFMTNKSKFNFRIISEINTNDLFCSECMLGDEHIIKLNKQRKIKNYKELLDKKCQELKYYDNYHLNDCNNPEHIFVCTFNKTTYVKAGNLLILEADIKSISNDFSRQLLKDFEVLRTIKLEIYLKLIKLRNIDVADFQELFNQILEFVFKGYLLKVLNE